MPVKVNIMVLTVIMVVITLRAQICAIASDLLQHCHWPYLLYLILSIEFAEVKFDDDTAIVSGRHDYLIGYSEA